MMRTLRTLLATSSAWFLQGCLQSPLPPHPTKQPIVVITFDDAHRSVFHEGFRRIRATDSTWRASHYFFTQALGREGNMSLAEVQESEAWGFENGGHGVEHENLASIPLDSVQAQIHAVDSFFTVHQLSLDSWAFAYGNYNDSVCELLKPHVRYLRTSHDLDYLPSPDPFHLGYFAVRKEHSLADLIQRVEEAVAFGSPLVVIGFHVILPPEADEVREYFTRTPIFQGFLDYLQQREFRVLSLRDAMQALGH